MLWLCLLLPDLPCELFTRAAVADIPLAVSDGPGRGARVVACNAAAAAAGVVPGQGVAAALGLAAGLVVRERRPERERAALERVAAWAGQYTATVSLCPPDALLLEAGGSLRLFGGPAALMDRVRGDAAALGYRVETALAPTPLAALWLARAGQPACVTRPGALARALSGLSVSCLGLEPAAAARLAGMGLRTLGDCLRQPRDGLARRLGPGLVRDLDRALGHLSDPRPAFAAPPRFAAAVELMGEVEDTAGLEFPLHRLVRELAGWLRAGQRGVAGLDLILVHRGRPETRLRLGLLGPTRDPARLMELARQRLARLRLVAPVERLGLEAAETEPLAGRDRDWLPGTRDDADADGGWLVERLRARLGSGAVTGITPVADHRPERAWRRCPPGAAAAVAPAGRRPLWLLSAPRGLEIRDGRPWLDGPLRLEPGRERIEAGWWEEADRERDYFVARGADGRRYWVFREHGARGAWYLHGVFS